jgi:hypothetical protein
VSKEAQQTWIYNFKFRMSPLPGESLESTLFPGNADIFIFFLSSSIVAIGGGSIEGARAPPLREIFT